MRDQEIVGLYEAYASIYENSNVDEEVEAWVNALVEEGYDLSEYTWDDMCEMYMNEVEQLDEISQKLATKAYAQSATGEFEGKDDAKDVKRTDNLRKHIKRKFGDKAAADADRHADSTTFGRKDPRTGKRQPKPQSRFQRPNTYRTTKKGTMHGQDQNKLKAKLKRRIGEEYVNSDLFDTILEYLVAEGYADTNEAAVTIMANMSEDWRQSIVEAQEARNNPEDYEERQRKLKSKKQTAMKDPDRGINSPAFAAFMKKQMGR